MDIKTLKEKGAMFGAPYYGSVFAETDEAVYCITDGEKVELVRHKAKKEKVAYKREPSRFEIESERIELMLGIYFILILAAAAFNIFAWVILPAIQA